MDVPRCQPHHVPLEYEAVSGSICPHMENSVAELQGTGLVQVISHPDPVGSISSNERIENETTHMRNCYNRLVAVASTLGVSVNALEQNGITTFAGPQPQVNKLKSLLSQTQDWLVC